jgi:hypothetical protein
MKIKKKDAFLIQSYIDNQEKIIDELKKKYMANSQLYDILKGKPPELMAFAATFKGIVKKRIYKYVSDLKDLKLNINGSDLLRLGCQPSKDIGFILDYLLRLKLDGKIKNKDEEVKEALALIESLKQEQQLPKPR